MGDYESEFAFSSGAACLKDGGNIKKNNIK
jgi:hypothetical protein